MGGCFNTGAISWDSHTLQIQLQLQDQHQALPLPLLQLTAAAENNSCVLITPRFGIHCHRETQKYSQDTNTSSLTLDPPQQPPLLSLFPSHPPTLNSTLSFSQDTGNFFQPPPTHIYPGLDIRSRLGSNTSTTGMAHTHHLPRATPLPHPGPQISTREQYSHSIPSYRREHPHPSRSPSFPPSTLRRHPLSPTTSPMSAFNTSAANRMGTGQTYGRAPSHTSTNIPPLMEIQLMGSLQYGDGAATPIKPEIHGTIDKGFFLSENDWTCYRRNYFNCVCSFQLTPDFPGTPIQFTPNNSTQLYQVYGFAMCISAVVSDNEAHTIELVQHTPKRDKGPVQKPEKVRLTAKQPQTSHYHSMGMYSDAMAPSRSMYGDSFGSQPSSQPHPHEHTFERIQFKQATQNNGKRRAAQQYYQLVVELWADVGNAGPGNDPFVKVAVRKSAKMIVRGRSPGHYQNDRRGSQSGPGGPAGAMGGYAPSGGLGDFSSNPMMAGPSYATGFDGRNIYGGVRHHDIPHESMIPTEDVKAVDTTKEYQYFPGSMYENHSDRVDLFPRTEAELGVPHMTTGLDIHGKMKTEYDGMPLPSIFQPPPLLVGERRPGPFEGKSSSNGYYPTVMSPSGVSMM